MIKGTTPTHTFELPLDTSLIEDVRIVYSQSNNVILTKTIDDCEISENKISVKLTQEDTFCFTNVPFVEIQIRVSIGDTVMSSIPLKIALVKCLEDGVVM